MIYGTNDLASLAEAVESRARAHRRVVYGLLIAAVAVAWALARRDDGRTASSARSLDSLVAVSAHQRALLALSERRADSIDRVAQHAASELLRHADQADTHAVPRIAIRPLPSVLHGEAAGDTGSLCAAHACIRTDSSWRAVYAIDSAAGTDSVPHLVDGYTARLLDSLIATANDFKAFRLETRATVAALQADVAAARTAEADAVALAHTAEQERDAALALVPSRLQRLWHDTKIIGGTVAVLTVAGWLLSAAK